MKPGVLFCIGTIVLQIACTSNKEAGYVWMQQALDTTRLQFNGLYNVFNTSILPNGKKASDRYTTTTLVIFKNNRRIFRESGNSIDSLPFTCTYYKQPNRKATGLYEIRGDSIVAYMPCYFALRGMRFRIYNAWFKGYLKNRDTITNWQVVPPYPEKIGQWELKAGENKNLFTPQVLYFIKTEAVACLQSDSLATR